MYRDLRIGLRQFGQSPIALASLTVGLALGIAANLVIFVQIYSLLVARRLPDSGRIVVVEQSSGPSAAADASAFSAGLSFPDFDDFSQQQHTFEAFGGFNADDLAVMTGTERPQRVCRIFVTLGALSALGAPTIAGRLPEPADFEPGAPGAVILVEDAWRRYFAADRSAIGRTVALDGQSLTVIGVAAQSVTDALRPRQQLFATPRNDLCVITPLVKGLSGESEPLITYLRTQRTRSWLLPIGRVRADTTISDAQAEASAIAARLQAQRPSSSPEMRLHLIPLAAWQTSGVRSLLLMLTVAAVLVLLVAFVNAIGLVAAEHVGRVTELAVRQALGANAWGLTRLVVLRSILWCLPGGVLGLAVAGVAVGWAARARFATRSPEAPWVLLACAAASALITVTVGLGSGVVASWAAGRRSVSQVLRDGGYGSTGYRQHGLAGLALGMQVASAVALTIGAGLLLRSAWLVSTADYGFERAHAFALEIRLPTSEYRTITDQNEFHREVLSRVRDLPGVVAAGASVSPPLTNASAMLSGDLVLNTGMARHDLDRVSAEFMTSGYLEAAGFTLARGRFATEDDEQAGPRMIVVDEAFCRGVLAPNENPLSATLSVGRQRYQIVGVVHDVRRSLGLAGEPEMNTSGGHIYVPLSAFNRPTRWSFLVVRASADLPRLAETTAEIVRALNPLVFVGEARTFQQIVTDQASELRRLLTLLGTMSCVLLLLMAASLAAALSQSVASRTREIAIRYCLGARPHEVAMFLLKHVGASLAVGLVVGAGAGLLAGRLLRSELYGVQPTDAATLAGVILVLVVAGVLGAAGPIRHAYRVNPVLVVRGS